jgi:nitrogen regulatory protein PII 1
MKMIRAIVRPEKAENVAESLAAAGFPALTKMEVYGRGKQRGITVDQIHYEELPKTMIMMVVEDGDVQKVTDCMQTSARTGHFGDGKIFITNVDESYTIRTSEKGL